MEQLPSHREELARSALSNLQGPGEQRTVLLAGIRITALTRKEWVELMVRDCSGERASRKPKLLSSANGNVVSIYHRDPAFREMLDAMDAVDADGMPLVLASRLLAPQPLPDRVATTDFFHDAAEEAQRRGIRFYLLGGTAEENSRGVERVRKLYPNLLIHGHHGYFSPEDEPELVDDIVQRGTDVLWVGLGVPREQAFALRNAPRLDGVAWVKTCGGLMNFLSGTNPRAPSWMQATGMEWLFRLALEPRRLTIRYLKTNPHAIYLVLRHSRATRGRA